MLILHSFLWYSVLCLNVWETHKCLKPPRAATRHRPAWNVGDRKRQTKAQLALWVVWMLYTFVESLADRTVSYVVPFYSELKMGILLWMLASRTLGSNFVYTNFISPTLTLYSTPLDLLFSLVYELSEAIIWLLAFPVNRLRAALGLSSSSDDTQDGDGAVEETSLTPRTVVRRAKKVYEEIERSRMMERPGMVKARTASGAGAKKDPRLRERKMVLEKQAREKEERELEEEVEEMARVEREDSSAKVGWQGASSLMFPRPQPNLSRTSSSSSSSSSSIGVPSRPSSIVETHTTTTVRRGPSASLQPNAVASSASSSFTRPTTIRPSSNLNPSKSQPIASSSRLPLAEPSSSSNLSSNDNAVASTSTSSSSIKAKPSLFLPPTSSANTSSPSSSQNAPPSPIHPVLAAARSSLRPSTPPIQSPSTQHASVVVPPTPMPPGAFNFHTTFQPQQKPRTASIPTEIAQPSRPPSPPPAAVSPPRKRKITSSLPILRATPARKAKSKALLEMSHSHEEVVELDEREETEDEEGEAKGGGKKRRRRKLVFEESEEIDEEREIGEEMMGGKGKGRAVESETEEKMGEEEAKEEGEDEPKANPKPTRRITTASALPSKRTTITRPASAAATRNLPSTIAAAPSLRKPSATSSVPPTSTRSTRGVPQAAASSSSSTRTRTASGGPAAVAATSGRRSRVNSGENVEEKDEAVVVGRAGTTRGRGRGRGGKVVS